MGTVRASPPATSKPSANRSVPVEIALADGTKLVLIDNNEQPDDVIKRLTQHQNPVPVGGFIHFQTTRGDYRVHPSHVVSIRWIDQDDG
jgi:hypothetical protein